MESRIREAYQLKKSEALIKFEMVFPSMVKRAVYFETLNTLIEIKKPLFNKQYDG